MDIRQQALAAMTDMERLHVVLLELLVKYEPGSEFDPDRKRQRLVATPHRVPSYHGTFLGGDGQGNPPVWSAGRRIWSVSEIVAVRPQLRPILSSLLGTLQRHGLATEDDGAREELKQLTNDLVQQVNQHAGQMQRSQRSSPVTLRDPTIREVEPRWTPTELGESILDYYRLAGEEEITDAPDPGQPEG